MFDSLRSVSHKVILSVSKVLDPSKSPLKRETLMTVSPFSRGVRGVRGDLKVPKVTAKHLMATPRYAFGTLRERYQTLS